ncbi:MAG: hypothetical protein MUP70_04275 [Candidatus Aminicenantes bacterium]|nr:hypothetical protein [Candidatus Aminicenantes bacterium]
MFIKINLAAIPVVVVSFILWALTGGIYLSLVPENFAGQDNLGIGLSVLGLCLFLVDRLAYLFLNSRSWLIIMKTWLWGMGFMIAGLSVWIGALSSKNLMVFIIHWLVSLAIIGVLTWFSLEHVEPKPKLKPEAAGIESDAGEESEARRK